VRSDRAGRLEARSADSIVCILEFADISVGSATCADNIVGKTVWADLIVGHTVTPFARRLVTAG
jgi:hypothetical protein